MRGDEKWVQTERKLMFEWKKKRKSENFKMCPIMMKSNDFTGISTNSVEIALQLVKWKEKEEKEREMRDYTKTWQKTCKIRFF